MLITIARIAILPVMRIHSEKIAAWLGLTPNNHNMEAPESAERPFIARDDESIGVSAQPRCLSLDLEVGKADDRIRAFGAVRADTGERLAHSGGDLAAALVKIDDLADGATFILGHNLIAFDLPHLAAPKPALLLLTLPAVDTLRLSPLAFPRNPYHHLAKHYQDGGLKRGRINDPELDARLALEVFGDEWRELMGAQLDLLAAWHWLSTPQPEGVDRALDDLFAGLHGARRPKGANRRNRQGARPNRHRTGGRAVPARREGR